MWVDFFSSRFSCKAVDCDACRECDLTRQMKEATRCRDLRNGFGRSLRRWVRLSGRIWSVN